MFWFVVSKAVCFHLSMSAPCFHVRKMWCTAEKRFMWHVCRRNPFRLFFLAKTFNSWRHQKVGEGELLSWELRIQLEHRQWWIRIIFRRTFSVPKICPPWFQATHACHSEVSNRCFGLWSPRPFVSIFQCQPHVSMFAKCDALPKRGLCDMFVEGIHSGYSSLQRHSTHEDIRKSVRVNYWVGSCESSSNIASDGFELFFAVHFLYPKFVLPGSKQLMPVTVKFQIDVLVCGLQGRLFPSFNVSPMFPCSQNVMHCRKEVYVTCLSKESIPAILPCKDIQLMKTSESRWGWIIELGVANPARTSPVMDSNYFSPYIFCTQNLSSLVPGNSCLSQWSFK